MNVKMPPQLIIGADLSVLLLDAARRTALATARFAFRRHRPRGKALTPGQETPMWNELIAAVHGQMQRRGDRANLARELDLPRQRVTEMLRSKTYLPDAERTLRILVWLHQRQNEKSSSRMKQDNMSRNT